MRCDDSIEVGKDSRNHCITEINKDNGDNERWVSPPKFAFAPSSLLEIPSDVVYKQLYYLRMAQMRQGVDLKGLSRIQWGLSPLKFSHHIVLKKNPWRDIDVSVIFQVTVCKTCCPSQEPNTNLGVYADQESALLVNDVHEILSGRCEKLTVLRREDAMFFHHLTARTLDEIQGVLLPPAPVLSVLEKLRIESANAASLALEELEEKKRKRSSTMDILIESSTYLSLSMTSRENSSSNGEGEEGEDEEVDDDDVEGEEENYYDESDMYSSSSTYRNHAPFSSSSLSVLRSHSPALNVWSNEGETSITEKYVEKVDAPFLHLLAQSQPRNRKSNRPRASTFSAVSLAHNHANSQSLLDAEAERTPLGMVTWLASLEDDDFVAAKLLTELTELSSKEKDAPSGSTLHKCDIPRFRGARSKDKELKDSLIRSREGDIEPSTQPPSQRRRRANSVIEVTRQLKSDSPPLPVTGAGTYRTYKKDPNWASEGRTRGYVGAYSPAERRRRIERFLEKRRLRVWQKNVKYDVRKNFADSRIRVKGRFVKKEDQAAMMLSMSLEQGLQNQSLEIVKEEDESDCEGDMEESIEIDNISSSSSGHNNNDITVKLETCSDDDEGVEEEKNCEEKFLVKLKESEEHSNSMSSFVSGGGSGSGRGNDIGSNRDQIEGMS